MDAHKGSRAKGARGELEVVKLLQAWWRRLDPEAVFVRTGDQGRLQHDRRLHGDVHVQKAPHWRHHVEVKWREGWARDRWLRGAERSPVWGWWEQACTEALEAGRPPMLWVRKSRVPWLVVLPLRVPLPCDALAVLRSNEGVWKARVAVYDAAALLATDPARLVA